jgi:ketosteroid isomerase-like protein
MLTADELSDIEEIKQLSYTYYLGLDTSNLDLLMSVFADDAVFDMRGGDLSLLEGAAAIRDYFAESQIKAMKNQIHLATNHRIAVDGDTASGTCYFLVHGVAHSGAEIFAGGYHENEYVRTSSGWKFRYKNTVSLLTPEVSAIGGGISADRK